MQSKKNPALKTIILFLAVFALSAETVDFFATASSSKDSNMIKMTTDLFFAQFQAVDGYSVMTEETKTTIQAKKPAIFHFTRKSRKTRTAAGYAH